MDRAGLIEPKALESSFWERQMTEYRTVQKLSYLNGDGAWTAGQRSGFQRLLQKPRWQASLKPLNVKGSRYHGPGGLEYLPRDSANVLNSMQKVSDYMNQEIKVNPGRLNQTIG